jgi:hypothetical protein
MLFTRKQKRFTMEIFDNNFQAPPHERSKKKAAVSAAALNPLNEVQLIIGDIEYLTAGSLAILKQRGQEWYDKYPQGEPYINTNEGCSKIDLYNNQLAGYLKTDVPLAKNILMSASNVLGLNEDDAVTVKQFCHLFNCKEEDVRPVIQSIKPDAPMYEFFNTPEARAQAEKSKKNALKSIETLQPADDLSFEFNGLTYLTAGTIEILTQRAMEWFDRNPLGEPMYSRNDGYKYPIYTDQLVQLFRFSERMAQLLLWICRKVLGKYDGDVVSVREFCKLFFVDEPDFRRALRDVHTYATD